MALNTEGNKGEKKQTKNHTTEQVITQEFHLHEKNTSKLQHDTIFLKDLLLQVRTKFHDSLKENSYHALILNNYRLYSFHTKLLLSCVFVVAVS